MHSRHHLQVLRSDPPEVVVHDEPGACPYLPQTISRLPMRLPLRRLTREEFDQRLEVGDRRQGLVLYKTTCPNCQACEPIRIPVAEFQPNRSQRRIFKRGESVIETKFALPKVSSERVELYNTHKRGRGLLNGGDLLDKAGYASFLVDSCVETIEIQYRLKGESGLSGVAVVDRSNNALSAVYTYFDPSQRQLAMGVYSILKQIELCQKLGLQYLYLGLYVGECSSMAYKANYHPHERRVGEQWTRFENGK